MTEAVPLIQSQTELEALFARLEREPLLAIDTEAASFHRFTDRVYLLQVSSRRETGTSASPGTGAGRGIGEEVEVGTHLHYVQVCTLRNRWKVLTAWAAKLTASSQPDKSSS